jgi:hypothetical protein
MRRAPNPRNGRSDDRSAAEAAARCREWCANSGRSQVILISELVVYAAAPASRRT